MIKFDTLQLPSTPWKNGGGSTRELVSYPAGASLEDFAWRISIAEVGQSGPFSRFPGIDRVITLLDGAGMLLVCRGRYQHTLGTPYRPFAFRGEDEVFADLLGSASHDFNLMLRRELVDGEIDVLTQAKAISAAQQSLVLFAAQGEWEIIGNGNLRHDLTMGQAGIFYDQHDDLRLAPKQAGSTLLCASITPRQKAAHGR